MIKTTVAKLINAQEVLQKIVDTELPARECWKALRVLREIEKEANTITNTRRELCKKYAELDEQGNFKPDENGNYIYDFGQNGGEKEFYKRIQNAIDSAKADGADIVIAVGHVGDEEGSKPYVRKYILNEFCCRF